MKLQLGSSPGDFKFVEPRSLGVPMRVDAAQQLSVRGEIERAAIRLPQKPDLEAGVRAGLENHAAMGIARARKAHAAQAEHAVPRFEAARRYGLPAGAREQHVPVLIPG